MIGGARRVRQCLIDAGDDESLVKGMVKWKDQDGMMSGKRGDRDVLHTKSGVCRPDGFL